MPRPAQGPVLRRPPPVARVLERMTSTARRHGMFEPGVRVVAAVSGGPDSLCLLHSLVRLRRLLRIHVVCFHFDHRLREESKGDASYVRAQASRLGVPFVLREASTSPGRGESVEAWSRTVRYEALRAVLEELGGGVAAVGHTADDQAETVLLALLRGGGLGAMSAMAPVSRPIVRPLLEVTRQETEGFCRSLGLRPRRDPMNEDPSFMRAALRRDVLPLLEERLGRGVRSTIVRTAALLRQDAELLERMAEEAAPRVVFAGGNGSVLLDGAELSALPPSIAGRVVRRVLFDLGILADAGHVEAVVAMGAGRAGRQERRISLPGGLKASRERGYVRLSRPSLGR